MNTLSPEQVSSPLVVLGGANKSRVLAAIQYVHQHPGIQKIIFSGGKTAGSQRPSEAEYMRNMFEKKYPKFIENGGQIVLEEKACDTEDNAMQVVVLLRDTGQEVSKILLLTDATHLIRAGWAFQRQGIEVSRIATELLLWQRSKHHARRIKRLLQTPAFWKQTFIMEPIIQGLPQLSVFTYLIYWLYGDKKPVSKKIPNLKQENKRNY